MPVFKLYDCKLRLDGSVLNEVRRLGVTAPEIDVFRAIHGQDAVLDIKESGQVTRTDRQERERLNGIFANPAKTFGAALDRKKRMLTDLFGHERNPLPHEIEDAAAPAGEDEEIEAEVEASAPGPKSEAPAPRRTRVPPRTEAAKAAEADFAA